MRRIVVSLSGLIAAAVAFLTAVPGAYAMRVRATAGGGGASSVTRLPLTHQSGLGLWPISLIVIGGVVVLTVALGSLLFRGSRRTMALPA
jgi:hypothetical protein